MYTDAHATGEGYLRSPRDGSLRDIVATTLELERSAEVAVSRRLGVSLAAHLLATELGDTAQWGGEWIETEPTGPQGWWPAGQCGEALIAGLAALGMRWLCVGATAREHTTRLLRTAREIGVGVALRPSGDALSALEAEGAAAEVTLESLPLLLHAIIVRSSARSEPERSDVATPSEALRGLGRADNASFTAALQWILDVNVPVVALVTAAARQASLRSVVRAPHLAEASRVLPYHERIAALHAPGAMRMGGKEAALHLGVPILDKEGEREAAAGLRRCHEALAELLSAGHDVRVGSGAPGAGLAAGASFHDENALFAEHSPLEVAHG